MSYDGEIMVDGNYTHQYVEWLESENKRLRNKLSKLRSQLQKHNAYVNRNAKQELDHLPYHEEDGR